MTFSLKSLFLYGILKSTAAQDDSINLSNLVSSDYDFPEDVKTALGFNNSPVEVPETDSSYSILDDPNFGYRGKGPRKSKDAPAVDSAAEKGVEKEQNPPKDENLCEPIVGNKQTKFTSQCSETSCTVSCFSGNKILVPFYTDNEDQNHPLEYYNNDEFGRHVIFNCVKGKGGKYGWDIKYDVSTVKCLPEPKDLKPIEPDTEEDTRTLEEAIMRTEDAPVDMFAEILNQGNQKKEKKVVEEPPKKKERGKEKAEKPKEKDEIFEDFKDIVTTEQPKKQKLTVPGPTETELQVESPDERGKNNSEKDVFVDPGKNDDISGVTCPMAKKIPDNGNLICPNTTPSKKGDITDQNVQAGDLCKINCLRGYKSNGYTEITCLAVKNLRTGSIEGVWSEKRKVDCVLKELLTTTQASKTQTTLVSQEVTTEMATTAAPIYHGAFFASNMPNSVKLPHGYGDLTNSVEETSNLNSNEDRYLRHNIILQPGKCIVCNEAKSMKKCLMQQKTCTLKRSEVCFTEVRKEQGHVMINRGCLARKNCLGQYSNNIRYENHNPALLSEAGFRPDQQCRILSKDLARGKLVPDGKKVRTSQKCMSCHKSSFSVPYF